MRFSIDMQDCCGRWVVRTAGQLTIGVSRTVVECSNCGQVRVLTCTNRPLQEPA